MSCYILNLSPSLLNSVGFHSGLRSHIWFDTLFPLPSKISWVPFEHLPRPYNLLLSSSHLSLTRLYAHILCNTHRQSILMKFSTKIPIHTLSMPTPFYVISIHIYTYKSLKLCVVLATHYIYYYFYMYI